MLATLNAAYGGVRGQNQAVALDFVRYTKESVRIADVIGDAALSVGMRAVLAYGHLYTGQLREAERVADEAIRLVATDPHRSPEFVGISPLMGARVSRLFAVGCMRDPVTALREFPLVRQDATEAGYPEQALWALMWETELKYALGDTDGIRALAQTAMRLAENLGVINEMLAAVSRCDALACDRDWRTLLDIATDTLRGIRPRSAGRLWEPRVLALMGNAELELGNLEPDRAAAQESVTFMRESQALFNPHGYALLARAQLALTEPAADIAHTLDEYEELLARTEFHVYAGELHELRARLAAREGQHPKCTAALARAYACYTRFNMTEQAARIEALQVSGSSH